MGYGRRVTLSKQLIEYMKLHKISLEQDLEQLSNQMDAIDPNCKDYNELDIEYNWTSGQITAATHLLSVARDILGYSTEGE